MECKKTLRLGNEKYNKYGSRMIIVDYKNARYITVYFPDYNYYKNTSWSSFNKGTVKSPYCRTVFGVGYIGEGKYKTHNSDGTPTEYYARWKAMLERCYYKKDKVKGRNLAYEDCIVEEYLLNFQNYAEWLDEQVKNCPFEEWYIDKDILEKGNKIYDRKHMILVDRRLNNLFTKSDKVRGDYPIGSCPHKRDNVLEVHCSIIENGEKKSKYLGRFPLHQVEEAFLTYKRFKENYIKQVADEYKNSIPDKVYQALYNYEVEITD